jgi:hypothetical protein
MLKHFVGNEQQNFRVSSGTRASNSVASERAWREIYLKAFQIAVEEAKPWSVMGAYNKVNGTLACERYDLMTEILKNEWGFNGFVSTDWDFCGTNDNNAKAGVAVKMVDAAKTQLVLDAINNGSLTREMVRRNISGMMRSVMRSTSFQRMLKATKIASTGLTQIDASHFTEWTGKEWPRGADSTPAAPISLPTIDGGQRGKSVGSRFDSGIEAGSSLTYYIIVEQGGTYNFSFRMSSDNSAPYGNYGILINGAKVGEISGADTGGWHNWQNFGELAIPLQEGTHLLTLQIQGAGSHLRRIEIARSGAN